MIIHTVNEGDTIASLAKQYFTNENIIRDINELQRNADTQLIQGEELLIPIPTRTYTVKRTDTLSSIARRFGIKKQQLIANNPSLYGGERIKYNDILAIKYDNEGLGMAASNGYITPRANPELLSRALPYLVYVTAVGATSDTKNVYLDRGVAEIARNVKEAGKIPLLRIYDKSEGEFLKSETDKAELTDAIINAAKDAGFMGVVFSAIPAARNMPDEFSDFIVTVRRRMIGCDLIFFSEINENVPYNASELSDGAIFLYSKSDMEIIPSYKDGEQAAFTKYAEEAESSKTLVDISPYAFSGSNYIPICETMKTARDAGVKISSDENTKLSYFEINGNKYIFEPLSNVKAKLETLGELGYMGMNFDIERTPVSHLMLYHTMFSPISYSSLSGAI